MTPPRTAAPEVSAMWALLRTLARGDPRRANYAKFVPTYDLLVASARRHPFHRAGGRLGLERASGPRHTGNARRSVHRPGEHSVPASLELVPRDSCAEGSEHDRVSQRTHPFDDYLMSLARVVVLTTSFFVPGSVEEVAVVALTLAAAAAAAFSYVAWRQEAGSG